NKLIDLVFNVITISRSIKPSNIGLLTKPSHLTLGISSRITLDYTNRFLAQATGIEIGEHMSVADRLKRFCARWNTSRQQSADFLDQARVHHLTNAVINSPVQFLSRRV